MNKVIIFMMLVFCQYYSQAQQLFNNKSIILLDFDDKMQGYFKMPLIKGQGVKGLPEVCRKSAKDILIYNKLDLQKPNFKSHINVPLDNSLILKVQKGSKVKASVMIPVYYKLKKGETVYKVAKTLNQEEVEDLMERNNLSSHNVKVGTQLLLGWLPILPITSTDRALPTVQKQDLNTIEKGNQKPTKDQTTTNLPSKNTAPSKNQLAQKAITPSKMPEIKQRPLKEILEEKKMADKMMADKKARLEKEKMQQQHNLTPPKTAFVKKDTVTKVILSESDLKVKDDETKKWNNQKGIAYWQSSHRRSRNKYALHNTAPINSTILLYNPMLKKSVEAKVIGRIPYESFDNNVDVVLSAGAAEALGALDSRFMVEMKYRK